MSEKNNSLIWVVDDDRVARELIEDTLAMSGYTNVRVFNGKTNGGQEVISELKDGKKPDLIITDYDMPVTDGLAVARAAKESGVKTVIFSSNNDPKIKLQVSSLNAEFFEKPYTSLLMEAVNNMLAEDRVYQVHTQNEPPARQTVQHVLSAGI